MGKEFTPVAELTDARTDWLLLVRINRIYLNARPGMNPRDANMDCVAIDSDGQQIHIEIDRDLIETYRPTLREGQVYIISNFYVVPTTKYEPVTRAYKIEFMMGTTLVEYDGPPVDIPDLGFEFLDFDEIPNYLGDTQFLIDVIGILQGIRETEISPTKFGRSSRTNIELQDANEQTAKVTLWGQCSDDFLNSNIRGSSEPVVLIVTSLIVKRLQGIFRVSTTPASRFYANLDHEAVTMFRNRIQGNIQVPQLLPPEPTGRPRRVLQEGEPTMTVAQLLALPRNNITDRQFRTIAQIQRFDPQNGWFYDGCPDCTRKLRDSTIPVDCAHCGAKSVKGVPIYKLEAKMSDGTGTVVMIFFSSVAEQIVGTPIQILQNQQFTIRRRIPKMIASLEKSKWELQICINNKSLNSPHLIFNVNRVMRRITGDDAPSNAALLEPPPLLLLENGPPIQNSTHPLFSGFPSVAQTYFDAQLHSYPPASYRHRRPSTLALVNYQTTGHGNAQQSTVANTNGKEQITTNKFKTDGEYNAAAARKGKRPMTAEECRAAEKKAKAGPPARRELFLAPPTLKGVDIFSESYMQPMPRTDRNQECNSYKVENTSEAKTAEPLAIGFQIGTFSIMPELHSAIQPSQPFNNGQTSLFREVMTRPIEPTLSGNKDTLPSSGRRTESVGESALHFSEGPTLQERARQEEHDKRFWDDLKEAGYTAAELEEAGLFIKDSDEDNQHYHTPPQVPESPRTPSE